ncbi:hypothetical protein BAE44_0010471 [Dichanthelium oligosanthes]|uniref:RING-type E3 ubiquitin transferase n=1 Tax=Dichanthelium oligosanthes TaxID=888268 RepID=A0A1E5VTP8_9POAL|nr:hypothetical protein BAE44_0010471 [Dichanthelium oligosanthes]
MDPAAAAKPNRLWTSSETTRLDVVLWPPGGQSSELVLRFAVAVSHTWRGIGGGARSERQLRPPRHFTEDDSLVLSTSGPDYLLRGGDVRRFIREMMRRKLSKEFDDYFRFKDWDAAVPEGVEARIVEHVAALRRGGCTCEVYVDVSLTVWFVYSEAGALTLACFLATRDPTRRRASGGAGGLDDDGDGDAPSCSICFEEMAPDAEETRLPGCAHGFHRTCIGKWFEKASTCPMCRRDKLQYLPPDYRAVHDMMLS